MSKIQELRKSRGLNISGMSYEVRVHPTTLSLIERRKVVPGDYARKAICEFLELPEVVAFDENGLAAV